MFLDRGRLENSNLTYHAKHPVLVHGKYSLTRLLAKQVHRDTHHSGTATLATLLNESHYIVGLRQLSKAISHNCVTCQHMYLKTASQIMREFPAERVNNTSSVQSLPYHTQRPVKIKSYLWLFVCFRTKAIHMQICTELTSDNFYAALTRFTDHQGLPESVYMSNGKNLVGTSRELAECFNML